MREKRRGDGALSTREGNSPSPPLSKRLRGVAPECPEEKKRHKTAFLNLTLFAQRVVLYFVGRRPFRQLIGRKRMGGRTEEVYLLQKKA